MFLAGVAHPVERHLAKVEVASSSLVTRSIKKKQMLKHLLLFYSTVIMARKNKSDSPVDCCASPVSTAMHNSVSSLATDAFNGIDAVPGHIAEFDYVFYYSLNKYQIFL